MRPIVLAFAATLLISACGKSTSASAPTPAPISKAVVSCDWGGGTCDQYSGSIDPTFATNLESTCMMHGVSFSNGPCPTANQVAGHCELATSSGAMANDYYYYSPKYDPAAAQADCTSAVVGVKWVP